MNEEERLRIEARKKRIHEREEKEKEKKEKERALFLAKVSERSSSAKSREERDRIFKEESHLFFERTAGPTEVFSDVVYPDGYSVKPVREQVDILCQHFPDLDPVFDERVLTQPLPPNAEGWFAIPRWERLGTTYNEAVQKMLASIASSRSFKNEREHFLGPEQLCTLPKTANAFRRIGEMQDGRDILIVPCQFGLRHRARTVDFVRDEAMDNAEFGLTTFAVGCMLLTHPEREIGFEQLHPLCTGDEHGPAPMCAGNDMVIVFFSFESDGQLQLVLWCDTLNHAYEYAGAATGFLLL